MRRLALPLAACLSVGLFAIVGLWTAAAAELEPVPSGRDRGIGSKVADFTLKDLNGKDWSLASQAGKKATVVVFVSSECPMSNSYLRSIGDLAERYTPKGVAFVLINANPGEDEQQVRAHAKEYNVQLPLLRDEKHLAVGALAPAVNPEAFVLDSKLALRYRGRIDDGYVARQKKGRQVTRYDLQEAIEDVLAGKPVREPVTTAFGCPITTSTAARAAGKDEVTYNRDIAPIVQNKCQSCHRPGEVGPFSLTNYRQASKWADDIKEYTQNRKMPPWKPDSHGVFTNERGLSEREIALIAKWVDTGMKEGDPKDLPPPPVFTEGWQLGEPDLILTPSEPMTIGANGKDVFRVFVLPTNLTEDKFVSAVEVRPANKRVVHHTLNFLDTLGRGRKLEEEERRRENKADEQDHGPGYTVQMGVGFFPPSGTMGGWAPGNLMQPLPDGVGYYLPKGADIVLQVHYHRTGKVETDQTRIGLHFAKKPVTHRLQPVVIPGLFLVIPAGNDNFAVRGAIQVNQDITVYQITPHMHLLGRKIKATLTYPDGKTRELIAIKDWDYNWQETYYFKEPIPVPSGSKFTVEAFYDNSDKNPLNPNSPPKPVRLGEQTTDEMCFVFLGATSDKPGRINVTRIPATPSSE